MRSSLRDSVPHWLLTWLVSTALTVGLGELLRLECRWWLAASVLLLWCAALATAEHFGRLWATLSVWTVALGLCLLLSDRIMLFKAAQAAVLRTGAAGEYGELCLLLFCAAAALPLSALLRLYWVRAALSLGWIALWIFAAIREWPIPRIVPAAMIPLLLLTLSETIHLLRGDPSPGERLKRALLLSLLPATLLLGLLPAPAEPYDYPVLRSVANTVERLLQSIESSMSGQSVTEQQFRLNFNGVSDDAALGSDNGEADEPRILFANPQYAPGGTLYLFGNAWDRFDGRGWSNTLEPWAAEHLNWKLDTAEHVYAFWRLMKQGGSSVNFADFFRMNSVYLSYRNLDVRTMFSAMNSTRFYTDDARFPYDSAATGTLFDYVQQGETWYRVYFLEPNARTIGTLIAASEGTAYDGEANGPLWRRVAQDFEDSFQLNVRDYLSAEKVLAARAELIRSVYLDASGVSDRARALAQEITADCGSDYEKLLAIAAYLRDNYSYTLHPGAVPEDADLLDWLLFEGREGYCTWYATAATLLARSVGIPARYVQGYLGNELTASVFTPLGPEKAHAWCEGYIAGYGWVTVEATPGFQIAESGWLTADERRELQINAPSGAVHSEDDPFLNNANEHRSDQPGPGGHGASPEDTDAESEPETQRSRRLSALIPIIPPAALLTAWLYLRAKRKRRYAEADNATKLRLDLEQLLRDMRVMGYPRHQEESLRQYFAHLPWRYLPASEEDVAKMTALYDRTFFASTQPSAAELKEHREFAAAFRPPTLWQRIRCWF